MFVQSSLLQKNHLLYSLSLFNDYFQLSYITCLPIVQCLCDQASMGFMSCLDAVPFRFIDNEAVLVALVRFHQIVQTYSYPLSTFSFKFHILVTATLLD